MKPYTEQVLEQHGTGRPYIVRTFSSDVAEEELVWHRDKENRYVEAMHDTDWKFQLDNDLPIDLSNKKLFIPKETYHRLIKGTGDLVVKIWQED